MKKFGIVALFCEDIRQEASGQETMIGIFGDNIALGPMQGDGARFMPKFSVYIRCNFAIDYNLKSLSHRLISPNGSILMDAPTDLDIINQAKDQAKSANAPMLGLKTGAAFAPFQITELGRFSLFSYINDAEYLSGFVNIADNPPMA